MNKIRKYDLEIVVVICGAALMIFELLGSRIVAPYVGTSTYIWASLIGVILGSLSLGYYFGGRYSDSKPFVQPLGIIIFLSAIAIIFTTVVKDMIPSLIVIFPVSVELKSLLISIVLFAPASFLLGMVSPYAVRLRMNDVAKAGGTSGNLYAVSTFGSILGTFLAGFYLIPHFGSLTSLIVLVVVLILTSLFLLGRNMRTFINNFFLPKLLPILIFIIVYPALTLFFKNGNLVADIDTEYNRILIKESVDRETKRPILTLATDPFATQAAIFTDDINELVLDYSKFFKIVEIIKPDAVNALMIGGCVYTYPRDFLQNFPLASMDVVEIDPGMTEIAKKYFGLSDDPRMHIIHEDGRMYLNSNTKKYDIIFNDAFNSFFVPFQLTTIEAVRKNFEALHDDGIVVVNLISKSKGEGSNFFKAEYNTYKAVFPRVYVFTLNNFKDVDAVQNIILVASKSGKLLDFSGTTYEEKLWTGPIEADVPVLTDDFAPVEFYQRKSL